MLCGRWVTATAHTQTNSVNSKNTTVKIIKDTHLNKLDFFAILSYVLKY